MPVSDDHLEMVAAVDNGESMNSIARRKGISSQRVSAAVRRAREKMAQQGELEWRHPGPTSPR
jgi:hypothetical protein